MTCKLILSLSLYRLEVDWAEGSAYVSICALLGGNLWREVGVVEVHRIVLILINDRADFFNLITQTLQ